MRLRSILGVLAIAGAGPIASAEIVHFVNPAPGQPGHYNWFAPIGESCFLDVTLPAAEQPNQENGTSIGQGVSGFPVGGIFGVMVGTAGPGAILTSSFVVNSEPESRTLPLSYGQPLAGQVYSSFGYYSTGAPPFIESLFPEGERRYVGVRTDSGNYGWIEVERTGLTLSAFSWAYETVPGAPIRAGVVPSPCTLTLLAAAGLLRRSRR